MAKVEAAKPAVKKSATPGEKGPKKAKVKKVQYPGLVGPEGSDGVKVELVKDEATGKFKLPADFDAKLHQPLKRTDFKDPGAWYELRAQEAEERAVALRKEAVEARTTGSGAERSKLKRMQRMQADFAKLREELTAQGIDVDAFLKAHAATS